MLIKHVLTVTAALAVSSHATAQDQKAVLTLGQKSLLTQLCLEGKFTGEGNYAANAFLNQVLGSKIQGDSSMGAPQGNLVISNGKGNYTLVEMTANSSFSSENLKKGQNRQQGRNAQVSQVGYGAMIVEQGQVRNLDLIVSDYSTGVNDGQNVQFCRVGTATNSAIKDQTANTLQVIASHGEIFNQTKTQKVAEAVLDRVAKSGRTKLSDKELSIVKDILFGSFATNHSRDSSETAKVSEKLLEYVSDVRSQELAVKSGESIGQDEMKKVSLAKEEVKTMNLNLNAMKAAVVKVGYEVIGKKEMFVGENGLVADSNYHASGAKTHSLLRLVKDKRALDIVIEK